MLSAERGVSRPTACVIRIGEQERMLGGGEMLYNGRGLSLVL